MGPSGIGVAAIDWTKYIKDKNPAIDPLAAAIPGAQLVVVPECGHLSTLERPQAVNKSLVELMQSR